MKNVKYLFSQEASQQGMITSSGLDPEEERIISVGY